MFAALAKYDEKSARWVLGYSKRLVQETLREDKLERIGPFAKGVGRRWDTSSPEMKI